MRRAEGGATGRLPPDQAAGEEQRPEILPPLPELGNCASCGGRLRLVAGSTTCPTCGAWRRWASAHRIARQAAEGGE